MGKKWKRILRLRRNAAREAATETPEAAPTKVTVTAPEVVVEEKEETTAEDLAEAPKLSKESTTSAKSAKKTKSSKTTKRATKSK